MAEKEINNNAPFDYKTFESLSRLELEMFCSKKENQPGLDASFLEYVRNNAQKFDDHHLQMALYLLNVSKLHEGYREIVKYIEHPSRYVRFFAIKWITFLKDEDFDDLILNEAKRVMQKNIKNIEYVELKERLEKLPGVTLE